MTNGGSFGPPYFLRVTAELTYRSYGSIIALSEKAYIFWSCSGFEQGRDCGGKVCHESIC